MVHIYDNNELVDMVIMYGEALQNAAEAARIYAERFPNRVHPPPRAFVNCVQRGRENGDLRPHRGGHAGAPRPHRFVQVEEQVLDLVHEDPTISTRMIANQLEISQYKTWKTLKENQFNPFHIQKVQSLLPEDHPRRVEFCRWVLEQHQNDEHFLPNLLVSDEATFTRNGITNSHNSHVWAVENPHEVKEHHFQHQFQPINMWAGIVNGILIGPFELPNRLNGENYLHFLQNDLPGLLEDVPLNVRQNMWFLQDGAPPHYARNVREYLNRVFNGRWVGRGGFVPWPPRSPDLNPLDFCLWGWMKSLVYKTPVNTREELSARIEEVANIIRNKPAALLRACVESWLRRAQLCIEQNGDHFQQFL